MRPRASRVGSTGLHVTAQPFLVALLVVLLVTSAGAQPLPADPSTPSKPAAGLEARVPAQPNAAARPGYVCAPSPPYSQRLAAIVEAELAGRQGTYGVAVHHLDTGETFIRNAGQRFPAASVYKLLVLYETWRQVRLGRLSLATPLTIADDDAVEPEPAGGLAPGAVLSVKEALEAMIAVSSNAAAHALLRLLGRDAVNRSARALGLPDTMVPTAGTSTGVSDDEGAEVAATSPQDVLCYLTLLANGQLLGGPTSAEMRGLLFRQQIDDRLPALLPSSTPIAHKTGELPGVRNDAGIVYTTLGTYVVVVLTRGVDEREATATIARLSRRLYDCFTGS